MKVTVVTSLFTIWDMDVDAGQFLYFWKQRYVKTNSKKLKIRSLFLLICMTQCLFAYAQKEKWLIYTIEGELSDAGYSQWPDEGQRIIQVRALQQQLYEKGFLLASKIGEKEVGDSLFVTWQTGQRIQWVALRKGNINPAFLVKSGVQLERFSGRPFSIKEVLKVYKQLLDFSENTGYPFAAIRMDSLDYDQGNFSGALNWESGPYITFDSLRVTGEAKLKFRFLANLLQIKHGQPFSQQRVNQAVSQLNNLPYLRWSAEPELSFQNEEATLYLPLNQRRVNSLDGIIGFLPNEAQNGRLLLTGQFDLALMNVGGTGRTYELHWQRFNQASQRLNVNALEPLLLGSPIDLHVSFALLKEDSTFLNRDFRMDFGYRLPSNAYLKFFTRRQAGDLLTVADRDFQSLPQVGDFRYNNYGLGLEKSWLDDVFFPKRGTFAKMEFAIGNKIILQNTALPPELYNDIKLRSLQYYLTGRIDKHFYANANFGVFSRIAWGYLNNEQLLLNDLFRLGGLRSIRGFNENHFFSNRHLYLTIEPRYYFDTYSYFMIFADLGNIENRLAGTGADWPVATGAGLSLQTGNGIFNFIYALGKSNTQPFSFNLSKIHFGYTGRF
jgi:outer membrane protein assembly factor BamA